MQIPQQLRSRKTSEEQRALETFERLMRDFDSFRNTTLALCIVPKVVLRQVSVGVFQNQNQIIDENVSPFL